MLLEIPPEIFLYIFGSLIDVRDILACKAVSKLESLFGSICVIDSRL